MDGTKQLAATIGRDSWNAPTKTSDDVTINSYFEGIDYTTQVPDYQLFRHVAENSLGGRPSVSYYLTVECLEHLIARKERRVFEVCRRPLN